MKKSISTLCTLLLCAFSIASPSKLMADPYQGEQYYYEPAPVRGTSAGLTRYVGLGIVVIAAIAAGVAASNNDSSSVNHS